MTEVSDDFRSDHDLNEIAKNLCRQKVVKHFDLALIFTRDSIYARVRICYVNSVCPSVRLSAFSKLFFSESSCLNNPSVTSNGDTFKFNVPKTATIRNVIQNLLHRLDHFESASPTAVAATDDSLSAPSTDAETADYHEAMYSSHGTNAYDYQLTTLMLLDKHGEGFPAAFCFSNRVDELCMSVFLYVCKENIGCPLKDAVFMTDNTEVYFNARTHVMGQPAHRLLCTWHIDRAWRKNLSRINAGGLKTIHFPLISWKSKMI